jgi:hypothetical protein
MDGEPPLSRSHGRTREQGWRLTGLHAGNASALSVGRQIRGALNSERSDSLTRKVTWIPISLAGQGIQYLAKPLAFPNVKTAPADAQLLGGNLERACQGELLMAGLSEIVFHCR